MALKILCAYQHQEIFDFVKTSLASRDCELVKASSEALALFLAHKNFPCLIVAELMGEGGWALNLLAELKAEPELAQIPVVFLAWREAGLHLDTVPLPQGAEKIIAYPIESYEFYAAVSEYLFELEDRRAPESPE